MEYRAKNVRSTVNNRIDRKYIQKNAREFLK
jgi:hypothetical protein